MTVHHLSKCLQTLPEVSKEGFDNHKIEFEIKSHLLTQMETENKRLLNQLKHKAEKRLAELPQFNRKPR